MKKIHSIVLLLFSLLLQNCSDDEAIESRNTKQRISFSIDENLAPEIPDGSSLVITLTTASGDEVYSDHQLKLIRREGTVVSESVEVNAANLVLSELIVLREDEVIFASPKLGSAKAAEITSPLSYKFAVGNLAELTVPVEVADAKNVAAEKFGYTSFAKRGKNTFQLQTYFYYQGVKTPFSSYVQIKNADTAYYYYIDAGVNTLTFNGDPKGLYTLTTYRPGFYRKSVPFSLKQMKGKNNNLIDLLMEETHPEDVVKIVPQGEMVDFTLGMTGVGCIRTDYNVSSAEYAEFPRNATIVTPPDTTYMDFYSSESSPYDIVMVSGDLDQVVSMQNKAGARLLDLSRLPNLAIFKSANSTTEVLDFAANRNLRSLSLTNYAVYEFHLEGNAVLNDVSLQGIWQADHIISAIHANTSEQNIRDGSIRVIETALSAESLQKLNELQNNYNWSVTIDPL